MEYYFKNFAEQKVQTESDPFVWLLYFLYCSLRDAENKPDKVWESLKNRIKDFNFEKRSIPKIKNSAYFVLRNLRASSNSTLSTLTVSKLKSIQIKNCRGFGCDFNGDDKGVLIQFDSHNTIFYGPNGSGKSSLCDALEYKLTGQIREAARRSRKAHDYAKRIGSTSKPSIAISFVDSEIDGEELTEEQKKYYLQAFIEKNRIQEFSLFGSKDTGIKKEQILSVLIGMDDLSDLAKAFVQPPAFKTNLLTFKRSVVANEIIALNSANVSNTTLQKTYTDAIEAEQQKADSLLGKVAAALTDLDAELERIKNETETINADTLSLSSTSVVLHTKKKFEDILKSVEGGLQTYDELDKNLVAAKTDLSFLNLYTAIEELHTVVTDTCPACDTPLTLATRNPFAKATEELEKLKEIGEQEANFEKERARVNEALNSLEFLHNHLSSNINSIPSLKNLVPQNSTLYLSSPHYELTDRILIDNNLNAIKFEVQTLDNYFTELELIYQKVSKRQAIVIANNEKISELNERKNLVQSIKNVWQTSEIKLNEINVKLGSYTIELNKLNIEKATEDNYNDFIDSLISTYPTFYTSLQSFKDTEFQMRFGNLEKEIAGFYTQINKNDAEHEAVELFKINNSEADYKIEFQRKDSGLIEDASMKFSEGHLRSLGLAILLANAKINSLPFIIFDDVVNAIDSEHRANIIEMMIKDGYLKNVQQIVSTHDRLYWERFSIENQKGNFSSFVLKCTKAGVIHYSYHLSFKEKIQNALDHFDIRQALLYSRIWFETLAKQFCMENNVELSGTLKPNDFHVSIEPSLGSIYRKLRESLPDNDHLKVLHDDEINYKGINQEHHSFDEYNFNFIHSRTSNEVQKIFDAVSGLSEDIKFLKSHVSILDNLIELNKKGSAKVKELHSKIPLHIQQGIISRHLEVIQQIQNFPAKMLSLKIDGLSIENAESKIKKILIPSILDSLLAAALSKVLPSSP